MAIPPAEGSQPLYNAFFIFLKKIISTSLANLSPCSVSVPPDSNLNGQIPPHLPARQLTGF